MKWVVTSLGLLAALLLIFGGLTTSWWSQRTVDGMHASIGLREARVCRADRCANTTIENLERKESWMRAGAACYAAALLGGGLLLTLAALAALGRASRLIRRTTLVASITALLAGVGFVFVAPEFDGMNPSYSMYLYFVGAGLAIVASVLAIRGLSQSAN